MAGYSGTPLVKKLGIKEGFNVVFVNQPDGLLSHMSLPPHVSINAKSRKPVDFVLLFVQSQTALEKEFSRYAAKLTPAGMLWVSWPKKTSGMQSDLNENIVRDIGLAKGMVDVKVCAVSELWSGLKLVVPLAKR